MRTVFETRGDMDPCRCRRLRRQAPSRRGVARRPLRYDGFDHGLRIYHRPHGLRAPCRLMADKITTVRKARIGSYVGRLADNDIVRLNRSTLVFLGIASPTEV